MKTYRETHKKQQRQYLRNWNKRNEKKKNAQQLAQNHIPLQPFCEKCGSDQNLERHHPDYSKPLEVQTLCRSCHILIHRTD